MYRKDITQLIIDCWGRGYSAEETRDAIKKFKGIDIGLATVYRKRNSLTGQQMIDELQRQQQRDIYIMKTGIKNDAGEFTVQPNPELALKYRGDLLKTLMPIRIEKKVNQTNRNLTVIKMWQPNGDDGTETQRSNIALPPV